MLWDTNFLHCFVNLYPLFTMHIVCRPRLHIACSWSSEVLFKRIFVNDFWTRLTRCQDVKQTIKAQKERKQRTSAVPQCRRQRFSLRFFFKHHGQRHVETQVETLKLCDFGNIILLVQTDKYERTARIAIVSTEYESEQVFPLTSWIFSQWLSF